jgi:hypothetical protein
LSAGEIGLETNTNKIKLGNGATSWNSLPYFYGYIGAASINDLNDVTITDAQSGDVLRWNGSAWVNDPINLATDTIGAFVQNLVEGTGVTITNNTGENATPTIAIGQAVATSSSVTFARLETSGNVVVGGDLTVNGTTTTLNTETLSVEDNIVVLNSGATGAPTLDAGIEVERGSSTNVALKWNESADRWELTNNGSSYSPIITSSLLEERLWDDHSHPAVRVAQTTAFSASIIYVAGTADLDGGYGIGAYIEKATNGTLQIDGVNVVEGDRILVSNQTDAKINGIYNVTSPGSASTKWKLTRSSDFNSSLQYSITPGEYVTAYEGTDNGARSYIVVSTGTGTNGVHVIGTDDITFSEMSGTATLIAGTGIKFGGNEISSDLLAGAGLALTDNVFSMETISSSVVVSASTARTFVKDITVDSYGRVADFETAEIAIINLGTDTSGNYMSDVTQGTGVTITHTPGEGSNATIAIGQDVGISASVQFEAVQATSITAQSVSAPTFTGNVVGGVTGNVDGNVTGNVTGNLFGNVTGDVLGNVTGLHIGNVTGNVQGNLTGNVSGSVSGNVVGNLTGNVTGDVTGNTTGTHFGNVTGNLIGNVTGSVDGSISGNAATVSSISNHALDSLSDVTASSPTSGQYLKWNGSAWVPDIIDLSADTSGNFVSSINAGTGVSLTNGVAQEAGNPTISIGQAIGATDSPSFANMYLGNAQVDAQQITYNSGTGLATVTAVNHGLTVGARITVTGATQSGYNGTYSITSVPVSSTFTYQPAVGPSANIASGPFLVYVAGALTFEGSTGDSFETTIVAVDPTEDRIISLPDATTQLVGRDTTDTLTNKTLTSPTITGVSPVITLGGDLSGSVTLTDLGNGTLTAAIQPNSVALGTDTTGSYVANLVQGTGVTITNNSGEGATPTIAIAQDVATSASVTFDTITVTNLFATNSQSSNASELNVSDSKIVLNAGTTGAPTVDGAIIIDRGSSASVEIRWNETLDRWEATADGTNYTQIAAGAKMTIGDTPPPSPANGDFWFESDSAITFVYYDSYWIEIGASGIGAVTTASAPSNAANGQIWFKSTTNEMFVYYDGVWVLVNSTTSTSDIEVASIMGVY